MWLLCWSWYYDTYVTVDDLYAGVNDNEVSDMYDIDEDNIILLALQHVMIIFVVAAVAAVVVVGNDAFGGY